LSSKGWNLLSSHFKSDSFKAAVVTVCIESKVAAELLTLIDEMPWLITSSSFQAYISEARRPSFSAQLKTADVCIAIIDFDSDPAAAAITTMYLQQIFPRRLTVVCMASNSAQDVLLLAMRAGCSEFIAKPFDPGIFRETLRRLQHLWSGTAYQPTPSGSVLAFFGVKGGVGTTTLALHLGMHLVLTHKKKVLLIDFHPELGHACIYLGLDGSRYTFQEVVRNVNRLDSELLQGYIAKHPSGLNVLSSPDQGGETRPIDADATAATLDFLRNEFDYVIVDCTTSLAEANLAVIAAASVVYMVATPEVGAIRDLSRYVDKLMQIEDTPDKISVVINRFATPSTVSVEQIEKAIMMPISFKLAASYLELVQACNLGEPVSPESKSDFSTSMTKWASSLTGVTPAAIAGKKPGFSLWK
jgi:pilus assembly protein CpaE